MFSSGGHDILYVHFFFFRIIKKRLSSDSDSSGSDNSSSTVLLSKRLPSPPRILDCAPSLKRHNAFYEKTTPPEGSSASTSNLHPEKPEGILFDSSFDI